MNWNYRNTLYLLLDDYFSVAWDNLNRYVVSITKTVDNKLTAAQECDYGKKTPVNRMPAASTVVSTGLPSPQLISTVRVSFVPLSTMPPLTVMLSPSLTPAGL